MHGVIINATVSVSKFRRSMQSHNQSDDEFPGPALSVVSGRRLGASWWLCWAALRLASLFLCSHDLVPERNVGLIAAIYSQLVLHSLARTAYTYKLRMGPLHPELLGLVPAVMEVVLEPLRTAAESSCYLHKRSEELCSDHPFHFSFAVMC